MSEISKEMIRAACMANFHPDAEPSETEMAKMERSLRAALAVPTAIGEVTLAPVYRFLVEGDIIEATDEFISDDFNSWYPPAGWEVGMEYPAKLFKPGRRRVHPALCSFPAIGEGSRVPSPHEYAMEYEFRGDGDYTPTDAERTMIEDAICGYLGEVSALRSPSEPVSVVEPVAWHCVGSGDGWAEDKITRDRETAEDYARRPHQWRVTPLYAFPPDGELTRMRETLEEIANSDDVENALDPERNKRVARAALSVRGSDHE